MSKIEYQINDLCERLDQHAMDDKEVQKEIKDQLQKILDNHLNHMEADIALLKYQGNLVLTIAKVVSTTAGVALIGSVLKLVLT